MKPVLLCGGVGKKMWPLSREKFPKHFLPLFNGKSLFQLNYETLLKKFKPEEIYIQTTPQQAKTALEQAPGVPVKNCFIEPELRDHGPAMGFMAVKLAQIDPNEPFILIQVDVIRDPGEKFLEMIEQADLLVRKEGKLLTGGFRPDSAVMGVDYLIADRRLDGFDKMNILKMDKWLGRGEKEEIDGYLRKKSIFLHANHYSWTPKLFLEAYAKWAPDWYESLQKIAAALDKQEGEKIVKEEYAKMEKGPAERVTKSVLADGYIIEIPFRWLDFGTWESLFNYQEEKGAYNPGENVFTLEARNCFIQKNDKNFVALIGVENLVVIDTNDALLICKKDQSGRVGDVVAHLKEKGKKEYL